MDLRTTLSLMNSAELVLWAALSFLFWRKKLFLRFPAMGRYLALRLASTPVLLFLDYGQSRNWLDGRLFDIYFVAYYAVYIASAILLYFICIEVFRSVLSAFSGLMRLGTIVFRWVTLASLVVALSTISFTHHGTTIIAEVAYNLMRSVGSLELCLLGFLCLSMNALRLPLRGIAFGISLGFGLLSANDLIVASLVSRYTTSTDPILFVGESLILVALAFWTVWFALPEELHKPVVIPASSPIYRWNEIAAALGHPGTKVAVQPASSFFLTDVERVVEKVLIRNMDKRESES